MEPVAISWLVASATSPLIAVLALWTVYVFHTYRKRWRTVDLFLLAITSQELVAAVFNFGYAIISLINPPVPALCSFVHWGIISVRTFQITTLTSMVVDRALTVRWPYRYRFSVRRNQIRYHIAVLALMAVLVGVAAVFAHHLPNNRPGLCSTHPRDWDFKFVVFVLGFYGGLLLVSVGCTLQIEIHKCRNGGMHEDKSRPFQLPDCPGSDLPVPTSATGPLDNDSHTGSTKALHRTYRHSSRRPYNKKGNSSHSDFRWPPVAVVSLVCFSVNHLPYLVLTSLATAMPWLWSSWHEALLCWLRLAEGVLVPLILCLVDKPVRTALKRTFQRRSGALSPLVGDDGPFQMYFDKDHFRKRGTFGSVTPIGIITNYRRTPGKKRNRKCKYKLPGLHSGDSVIEKSCLSGSFLSTEPLSKLSCADLTTLEVWQEEDEENFYATLSDDFSNFSVNSTDDNGADDEVKICDEIYGGSFTTIANDDFEFHDTRPCGGEVRMKPAMNVAVQSVNSFRSSTRSTTFSRDKLKETDKLKICSTENLNDLMNLSLISEEDKKDPDIFIRADGTLDPEPDLIKTDDENSGSPTSLSKATSFSMNDLDLIEKENPHGQDNHFALPVKSESTMSLYRLGLDKNIPQFLPMTKSETNVSGFDSRTPVANPIWPGYPVRKASDPLFHNRKPGAPASYVSTKNYPCILHPRMQKIPWISAWKKFGGGMVESSEVRKGRRGKDTETALRNDDPAALRMMLLSDNFELRQRNAFHWKDSVIYARDCSKELNDRILSGNPIEFRENSEECAYGSAHYKERHARNDPILSDRNKNPRKNSFKSHAPKAIVEEDPYGRLNNVNTNCKANISIDFGGSNPMTEENIYEEIISNRARRKDSRGLRRNNSGAEDKSYAQTDIFKLANLNNPIHQDVNPKDFKLNINVNSTRNVADPLTLNCTSNMSPQKDSFAQHGSNFVIKCPQFNNEIMTSDFPKLVHSGRIDDKHNYNNRVHVTYNVNDSALEFIDKSEESVYHPTPYQRHSSMNTHEDFNANSSQTYPIENQCKNYDLKFYNHGVTSALCRRESNRARCKEVNVKRRDSKKAKNEGHVDSSVACGAGSVQKVANWPVARRESDKGERAREVRRRESGSKNKRESNLGRRESDHRSKKPRPAQYEEQGPDKRGHGIQLQRNDSYGLGHEKKTPWARELIQETGNIANNLDVRTVGTCIQVDEQMLSKLPNNFGYGEIDRARKDPYDSREEFHVSNGIIRLHCGHQDDYKYAGNVNRFVSNPNYSQVESGIRDTDSNRMQISKRRSGSTDNDHSRNYIELCYDDGVLQQSPPQMDRPKKHDLDRKPSDSKVRRKTSVNRNKREVGELEKKESFREKRRPAARKAGTGESKAPNRVRRTNSFHTPHELNANLNSDMADMNRNESTKLNTNLAMNDEHVRMDNLVYGDRRDNANSARDAEVFPFETFIKPPSYNNLMKHHISERSDPAYKERSNQRKIAITDYL